MIIFAKIVDLQRFLNEKRSNNATIGFVPTMGALHLGHISLIKQSKKVTDVTVCSIFVNPTQFNDKRDLEKYPRMPKQDSELLDNVGCDVLFLPDVGEIYPQNDTSIFNPIVTGFGDLDKVLEATFRPGHFNGVAQVVSRLFEIVKPTKAFFGSKDYQQVMVVKALVKLLQLPIEIVACPILREDDGLAMSSRNMLMSAEERECAKLIPALLQKSINLKNEGKSIAEIREYVVIELSKKPIYKLNYFAICNAETLEEQTVFTNNVTSMALIACFVGKVRLIDNLIIN